MIEAKKAANSTSAVKITESGGERRHRGKDIDLHLNRRADSKRKKNDELRRKSWVRWGTEREEKLPHSLKNTDLKRTNLSNLHHKFSSRGRQRAARERGER